MITIHQEDQFNLIIGASATTRAAIQAQDGTRTGHTSKHFCLGQLSNYKSKDFNENPPIELSMTLSFLLEPILMPEVVEKPELVEMPTALERHFTSRSRPVSAS